VKNVVEASKIASLNKISEGDSVDDSASTAVAENGSPRA
jgi:hypothetical protein